MTWIARGCMSGVGHSDRIRFARDERLTLLNSHSTNRLALSLSPAELDWPGHCHCPNHLRSNGSMSLRTSETHPMQIGVVQATPAHGRIGITFCPGKYDPNAMTGGWHRNLDIDLDAIRDWGANLVLTLVEQQELEQLRVARLGDSVRARSIQWLHLPIKDYHPPSALFEESWVTHGAHIRHLLRKGSDVVVHCKGGLGRAGMIAARLLVELGMPPEEAMNLVRAVRKGAIETIDQEDVVRQTKAMP
jgi:protein-tyrosine phosphatase